MDHKFFLFSVEGRRYAIHLQAVERVVHAVEITPVPDKSDFLLGIINLQGTIVPVMSLRRKFGLPEKEITIDDTIIIVRLMKWTVAFIVDSVEGVINRSDQEITAAGDIMPSLDYTEGVVKVDNEMALIYDIDRSLSFDDKNRIQAVLIKG